MDMANPDHICAEEKKKDYRLSAILFLATLKYYGFFIKKIRKNNLLLWRRSNLVNLATSVYNLVGRD